MVPLVGGEWAEVKTLAVGTAAAGTVVAVSDGVGLFRGVVDLRLPDAVRLLDFPHAVAHLG